MIKDAYCSCGPSIEGKYYFKGLQGPKSKDKYEGMALK